MLKVAKERLQIVRVTQDNLAKAQKLWKAIAQNPVRRVDITSDIHVASYNPANYVPGKRKHASCMWLVEVVMQRGVLILFCC